MNWNFDNLKPYGQTVTATFTIEGGVSGWLKRFCKTRHLGRSQALRYLITQAVEFWIKERQPLNRQHEYPWAQFQARGLRTVFESVILDVRIHESLRQIAELSGKTMSKV